MTPAPTSRRSGRALTARQVADRFGVGEQTVRRWSRAGRLEAVRTRFGLRYRLADIERLEVELAAEP